MFFRHSALLVVWSLSVFTCCQQCRSEPPRNRPLQRHACDLILNSGIISVRYVSARGDAIRNATALIRQQGRILTIVATDEHGIATFSGLSSGIYEITIGNRSEFVRLWTEDSAPALAKDPLTLIQDSRPIGASGPYAALSLMSPGGSPAPFLLKSEDAIRTCRNCEIRLTPEP